MIARACWIDIPGHFPQVELDEFIIMPNHLHGVIVITDGVRVGAQHAVPLRDHPTEEQFGKPVPGSVPIIVRSYKPAVTRRINTARGMPGIRVWQRNYHEHVVRDDRDLDNIRQYIIDSPATWDTDRENPHGVGA
jgi:putative transposase